NGAAVLEGGVGEFGAVPAHRQVRAVELQHEPGGDDRPVLGAHRVRHAEEHLWGVARACLGDAASAWVGEPLEHLHHARIDALLAAISALPAPTIAAADLMRTTATYFAKRRAMLDYPTFRSRGYQIGSGLAESACKGLVGQREKGPGMQWTTPGAQAIATLRAAHLTGRWEEVLEAAKAA